MAPSPFRGLGPLEGRDEGSRNLCFFLIWAENFKNSMGFQKCSNGQVPEQRMRFGSKLSVRIVQLGTKLNTKIGLNHHPPPGTFQREGKVLGVPNSVCKH